MTGFDPDISVVIAAWNAEKTLERAISSALEQRGVTVEVFVVDDASTDATCALARKYEALDHRVRVLLNAKNSGPATARNRALDAARAPFVALLDADDAMSPERLASLMEIACSGDWDFVADDLYKVSDLETHADKTRLWTEADLGLTPLSFEDFVRGNLSALHGGRGELGFIKPLMRMDFLDRHGLRYDPSMRLGEDYALYATALARGARFCLTDPLGYYALVRRDSLSSNHRAADLGALVAADRVLSQEPGLSPNDQKVLALHEVETQKRWRWLRLIEAVRTRDVADALRCFAARPAVMADLCGKLGEQLLLRSIAALRGERAVSSEAESRKQ